MEAVATNLPVGLNESDFMRQLIQHLSGTLQDVIGVNDAKGFVSLVGQKMGDSINSQSKNALSLEQLSPLQVTGVLIDLKRRIIGDFYVIVKDENKIVLGNRTCPFGNLVK